MRHNADDLIPTLSDLDILAKGLPDKVAELEQRVIELENAFLYALAVLGYPIDHSDLDYDPIYQLIVKHNNRPENAPATAQLAGNHD